MGSSAAANFSEWGEIFGLNLMYISIIRSSLIHLQSFYLLEQLPMFVKMTPFLYTNRMNLSCLKPSLSRLALISKGFLDLKKMLLLIKIESQSPPRSLLLLTNCNNVWKKICYFSAIYSSSVIVFWILSAKSFCEIFFWEP